MLRWVEGAHLAPDTDAFRVVVEIDDKPFRVRVSFGGIAQLVERQLCKLDVRGSNPLASKPLAAARLILNLRIAIVDLNKCARSPACLADQKSTVENSKPAAQPPFGPVAQLVRACA